MSKSINEELQRTARQALIGVHPAPQGEEIGGLPFRRLLAAAFRARYLVFATTLFGILVGTFMAITTANSYVSTGKFRFTASGAEVTGIDPTRTSENSQESIGSGATYILSTDGLLRRVVDRVGPERILAPYQPEGDDASAAKAFFYRIQRDWNATRTEDLTAEEALKRLRRTISIERPRFTDLLVATCTANDPRLAQEILAAYLDEAKKWHIEKYEDKAAYLAAEQAATEALSTRDVASQRLREFLERHQLSDFEAEKKRLQSEETEAATRVVKLKDDLDIQRRTFDEWTRRLEGENAIPPRIKEKQKLDITTEALKGFSDQLGELEMARSVLVSKMRDPNSPEIIEKDRLIAACKESMRRLSREAISAEEVEIEVDNPEYLTAKEKRTEASLEVTVLETRQSYAAEIDRAAKQKLKEMLDLEPEYRRLSSALSHAEDSLKAADATWLSAQQKRALGQGNFSSLKDVEEASLPLEKEAPNRSKLILGATLVGLFLGLGLVLLLALPDRVVRTREDLEDLEGLAVIGVMPRLDQRNLKRHAFRRRRGL
ncbi:MAG: hypothetical protein KDC98_09630 [Planctomycetes bacterium]|nr:hypothetical protein [Planctomycetota bacterium]